MKKLIAIILCCLAFTGIAQARTNWRFYVGGMYAKGFDALGAGEDSDELYYENDKGVSEFKKQRKTFNIWAGMDIQFIIKDKFIIETGLNYRFAPYADFERYKYDGSYVGDPDNGILWELQESGNRHFASIPLRFGYHLTLNNKNSFDFCVGPYAAISLGTWTNHIFVGISPVITYKHRAFSVSLHYENPIFYNGSNSHLGGQFAVTIGVNFGGRKPNWDNILTGLEIAGSVLSATSSAISTYQGSTSSYSGSSSSSTSSNTSGENAKTMYYKWESRAKSAYNSLSGHSVSASTYNKNKKLLREAQQEMRSWRSKAQKAGITIPQSEWETKNVNLL